MKLNPSLWMVFAILVMARSSHAQNTTASPYFEVADDAKPGSFPLLHTGAEVKISGVIADVKVVQFYCNDGEQPIEASYVFPASANAAVYAMKMVVGDRVINAQIREKGEATRDYDKAKKAGKQASLLEQERPNVFRMRVANILPGDSIKVELSYTEIIVPKEGIYEFVYPTVVGPRYSHGEPKKILAARRWTSNPYLPEGSHPLNSFDISCNIMTGLPIQKVQSTSHNVDIDYESKARVVIKLQQKDKYRGNKDFVLKYQLSGKKIEQGLLLYQGKEENFFLAMIQPPERPAVQLVPRREYLFLLDVSGSMSGFPLEVSKQMIGELLNQLQPEDQFNILLFAGQSGLLAPSSLPASKANIQMAMNTVEQLSGGGGTEMLTAIKSVMRTPKQPGFARSFVILTDGYINFEPEVFRYIDEHLDEANFFAFGIGSSVNRHLMEGIAHYGKTNAFVALDAFEATDLAKQFKSYVQTPLLTNIKLAFNGLQAFDVTPSRLPDLMADRPLIVFGKYRGKASGSMTLNGINGNGKFSEQLTINQDLVSEDHSALKYLWARHRLKTLADFPDFSALGPGEVKRQITNLGLKYNLLTQHTSFIAIDHRKVKREGKIQLKQQRLPLPEGVSEKALGQRVWEETPEEEIPMAAPRTAEPPPPPPPPPGPANEEIFRLVEEMPRLEGCEPQDRNCTGTSILEFITQNLKYPPLARENGISGTVVIQFVVTKTGEIRNLKIIREIGAGCGQEALRLIKLMIEQNMKWLPGTQRGRPVNVVYNLPIRFKLD